MAQINPDITAHLNVLGQRARKAAAGLALATTEQKNDALREAAKALIDALPDLISANEADVASVMGHKADAFIDRLMLTPHRIEGMARALIDISELPDPVGRTLASFDRPNGLKINRVAVPIGVIGMIYKSRPNVGADASGLCLKSGNAIILRGGSESRRSTDIIVKAMQSGLMSAGLPKDAVQTVGTTDRSAVTALLQADQYVDLVIPRGGRGLVELVRDTAKVPTLLHLDGNCHSYVHSDADIDKAVAIITNAKMRRTGVCGATESIVVDKAVAPHFLPKLVDALKGCELRGDKASIAIDSRIMQASDDDWSTEYLDAVASVKIVSDIDSAITFISAHSSGHTDAIITENTNAARQFMASIDSAVVMHNASTQFSDGGEFGMGAEIGIATGKMHARGPVGLEQLTSFKYLVFGTGQIRP
ncbi:glutamate-5-semialdehyde dehydrogenase [Fretibacter rubidus]|uniref:glutamate-5-semialdehyde dehydrogenase n=1 Tax=Fretibacter rubidus TaxID=570162 RepID=UPI00352A41BE